MTMPTWIREFQIFSGVVTGLATVGGAIYIGWQGHKIAREQAKIAGHQASTAKQKLRFDLFPLRYEVYNAVLTEMVAALNDNVGVLNDRTTVRMHLLIRKARFLFDERSWLCLREIENKVYQLRLNRQIIGKSGIEDSSDYQRHLEAFSSSQKWMTSNTSLLAQRVEHLLKVDETLTISMAPERSDKASAETN